MRGIASLLLSLTFAATALAADQQWGFVRGSSDVRLFYGVPECDAVSLNIICGPRRKRINLVSFLLPPGPRQGATLKTKLTNGAAMLEYNGKVGRDQTHGVSYIEARVPFDEELFNFLNTGSTLTVEVPGKRADIPLKGILEPLALMEQACLGRH